MVVLYNALAMNAYDHGATSGELEILEILTQLREERVELENSILPSTNREHRFIIRERVATPYDGSR
jgi:hypothetical protein